MREKFETLEEAKVRLHRERGMRRSRGRRRAMVVVFVVMGLAAAVGLCWILLVSE